MPVEIKELVIRAVVEKKDGGSEAETGKSSVESDNAQVVEDCVRQVLKIIERKKER